MNPLRRTVSLTAMPAAMAMFLTVAPCASAAARAQTLREAAGKAAAAAQAESRDAKAQEREKREEDDEEEKDQDGGAVRPRSGLGWTGIGMASAGGMLILGAFTFNDSKGCGFFNEQSCKSVGRNYGVTGGAMVLTGLTLLVIDENRRHPKLPRAQPARQTSIEVGPRAVQVRMLF